MKLIRLGRSFVVVCTLFALGLALTSAMSGMQAAPQLVAENNSGGGGGG
jgi:hypothetical protein